MEFTLGLRHPFVSRLPRLPCGPSATEIVFALGAGDSLVGVTHECDYPVEVDPLPKLTRSRIPPGLSSEQIDVMSYLIGLGAHPNDKPNGGSSALDNCLRHLGWEDFDRIRYGHGRNYQTPAYKVSKTRDAIRLMIEYGAVWKPDAYSLSNVRRMLYRIEPDVTLELAGLLLKHQACDEDTIRNLFRPPRMQQHVASVERGLWRVGLTLEGRRRSEIKNASPSPYLLEQYDRQQLYKEVWSEPTRTVASRL